MTDDVPSAKKRKAQETVMRNTPVPNRTPPIITLAVLCKDAAASKRPNPLAKSTDPMTVGTLFSILSESLHRLACRPKTMAAAKDAALAQVENICNTSLNSENLCNGLTPVVSRNNIAVKAPLKR